MVSTAERRAGLPYGRLRGALTAAALLLLLTGPTALAFFSGGYFSTSRTWAGLVAWLLVVVAILTGAPVRPRSAAGGVAVAGLAALGAWTLLSTLWAPIRGTAYGAGQLTLLYAGGLIAGGALLRRTAVARLVEPGLALGVLVVIGYGLSNRLLPGLLHFQRSITADGRLEQPLTYWNAMGELAALGLVLAARITGDRTRPRGLRVVAAACAAPLGLGLYLSVSRGALFACAAGLITLVVLAPEWAQLRGIALAAGAGLLASLAAAPSPGVTSLGGVLATREREGAITLVLLLAIAAAAATAQFVLTRRERPGDLRLPRRAPLIALALVCAGLAFAIVVGSKESSAQPLAAGATRYTTLQSNRYAYWRVALKAFVAEPLRGVGAGGWAVWWLRDRTVAEGAQDAHSLPLQTMAELGIVGLALLLAFIGGVVVATRRAMRAAPALAAGPAAGLVVYLTHSPLDWDWQMPAVTLVAVVLAGLVIALGESSRRSAAAIDAP